VFISTTRPYLALSYGIGMCVGMVLGLVCEVFISATLRYPALS
jgi:hypothetical protein